MKPSPFLARSLASTVLVAAALIAPSARAEVPRCDGNDTATQARVRAEGLRRYRAATARGDINRVEMAAALEAFDAQCRAGDITALEMRAYALAALGRQVDAAESLDAFLEARPLQTLDADARARVGAQRGAILAEVATLTVDGSAPDSQVVVNGRPYGSLPRPIIRLAPGAVNLQVYGGNSIILRRSFQMGPGETRREAVEPGASTQSNGNSSNTGTTNTTSNTTSSTAATQGSNNATSGSTGSGSASGDLSNGGGGDAPPPVTDRPARRMSVAIPIALGAGAIAIAGVAVGASVWHGSRVAELMKPECTGAAPDPACATVAGERDAAQAVQISSIVVASGLAIGAVVTTILWIRSAPRQQQSAFACGPTVGNHGVACGGRF